MDQYDNTSYPPTPSSVTLQSAMSENQTIRENCWSCNRSRSLCYCKQIRPFKTDPLIVVLVHPKEFRKTIGTFRFVKLSITNSICIQGYGSDFDQNLQLQSLVTDPNHFSVILFPGESSINLSRITPHEIQELIPPRKRLVIFVIDGTWANARKMIRTSNTLNTLTRMSFDSNIPSRYQFRKQPHLHCLSTVEAVHVLIEKLAEKNLCSLPTNREHDQMLVNFNTMVENQIKLQVGPVRY